MIPVQAQRFGPERELRAVDRRQATLARDAQGPPRRITHKAVFEGPVKLEVQLAFPKMPDRSSAIVLFAEDAVARVAPMRALELGAEWAGGYDDRPPEEPDAWGDLASFREAAARS